MRADSDRNVRHFNTINRSKNMIKAIIAVIIIGVLAWFSALIYGVTFVVENSAEIGEGIGRAAGSVVKGYEETVQEK